MLRKNSHYVLIVALLGVALACASCDKLGLGTPKAKADAGAVKASAPAAKEAPAATSKEVLAKVGDWTLTLAQYNEKIAVLKEAMGDFDQNDPKIKQAILDELINQQILVKEAEQKGLDREKEVASAVEEYRKTLIVQRLAKGLVDNIQVTDQDVEEFYKNKDNEELFMKPEEWRVREIVVADEAKAKELLVSVLQGADFAEIAKANSTSATAANGGDIGFVADFEDPQVANVVLTLEPGQTSSVFKGKNGFYIVKLEEKRGGDMELLETIKAKPEEYEQLKQYVLSMKRQKVVTDYIEAAKKKANIVINQDLLK